MHTYVRASSHDRTRARCLLRSRSPFVQGRSADQLGLLVSFLPSDPANALHYR